MTVGQRRRRRRTAKVDRGLLAMAMIVTVVRQGVAEADDPKEEEEIRAALAWIYGESERAKSTECGT